MAAGGAQGMPQGQLMRGRTRCRSVSPIFAARTPLVSLVAVSERTDSPPGIIDMQTAIAASFAATVHGCPAWLKVAARATFLLLFLKSAAWLATSWLAFRGFGGL